MVTSSVVTNRNLSSRTDFRPYIVLFVAAAMVRLFMLSNIDGPGFFDKYLYFANKLVDGEDLGTRLIDLSPAYLYIVTAYVKLFGENWRLLEYLHSLAGCCVCLLIYMIGCRALDKRTGFVAALLYAFYGNVVILEATLEPVVFVLLFNSLAIYFLLKAEDSNPQSHQRLLNTLIAGLFTGISAITKASFLLFLPLATFWIALAAERLAPNKRRLILVLAFNIAALLPVFVITARNYAKLNDLILVTADSGKVFFHGNAKGATALQWTSLDDAGFIAETTNDPDNTHVLFRDTASRLVGRQLKPSEASSFWARRTLEDIFSNPGRYLKLEFKKALFFFHDYEMHFIPSVYSEYKRSLQYPFIRNGLIASLAIVGMALSFRRARSLTLIYGTIFIYLLSGLIFIVQSRYRTPAVPYLCLLAANGAWMIISMFRSGRTRNALVSVTTALVLLGLFNFSFRSELAFLDRWQTASKTRYANTAWPLFNKGRLWEAIVELDTVVKEFPNFSPAYNLRGRSYALLEEYQKASQDFEKVIALSPAVSEGYKNMGIVHYFESNYTNARSFLLRARALNPRDTHIDTLLDKKELKHEP